LRAVGPFYGFFGLGLALYFASQGAGRLAWPLIAGFARMFVAIGLGALVLHLTGSLGWLFACLGFGMVAYGAIIATAVVRGSWFAKAKSRVAREPASAPA
jgi:Na+-driven multidrug efflux pump